MKDKDGNDVYVHNLTTAKFESTYMEKKGVWRCKHSSVGVRSKTFNMQDFETKKIEITYIGKDHDETVSELLIHISMILKSINNDIFSLKKDIKVNVDNTNNQDSETT